MLSARQLKAARALVGLDANELAARIGVTPDTISNFETGKTQPRESTIEKAAKELATCGVEFLDHHGVRMRPAGLDVYEGRQRFDDFYDFLYQRVKEKGGDICLSVSDERLLAAYRSDTTRHYKRMQDLFDAKGFKSFRILANKSNFASDYTYNTYRWEPSKASAPVAFYVFAECLALISFVHDTPPYVVVLQSPPLATAYQQAFNAAWAAAKVPPKKSRGRS
jgi:transcriptional regulator with XRE-family HTH domain